MVTGGADLGALVTEARAGSRRALGRLFSRAEAVEGDAAGRDFLRALDRAAGAAGAPHAASAAGPPGVVGLTGGPGAGKSTLAAALAAHWNRAGRRVAVLAVDPSSPVTGGAVLGDRVRFEPGTGPGPDGATTAVRSFGARGHAGGLAAAVPLAVTVAAAVGFDEIVVETVGGGQGDTAVTGVVATTVLVVAPGTGDEVQALKAGIGEVADVVCVGKADLPAAAEALRQWRAVARGARADGWTPRVVPAGARTGDVAALVAAIGEHRAWTAGRAAASPRARRLPRPPASTGGAEAAWSRAAAAADAGDAAAVLDALAAALAAAAPASPAAAADLRELVADVRARVARLS